MCGCSARMSSCMSQSCRCCSYRSCSACCHTSCGDSSNSRPRRTLVAGPDLRDLVTLLAMVATSLCAPVSGAQPLLQTVSQNGVVRVDSADIARHARDVQAMFEHRRRQMLPRLYIGTADRCVLVGRFC